MTARVTIARGELESIRADAVGVFVGEKEKGTGPIPRALRQLVQRELERVHFVPRAGETAAVPVPGGAGPRVVIVTGLGERARVDPETLRRAAAALARRARREHARAVALALPVAGGLDTFACAQGVAEGLLLGLYRFDRFVTDEARKTPDPERFVLVSGDGGATPSRALERAEAVVASVALARDLVNLPAGDLGPEAAVREIRRAVRGTSVKVRVFGPDELARQKMGALLAVARGSDQPPRLVHLKYQPARRTRRRLALIGKGVTFDSGGYNLKLGDNMETMKCDMAGGAAVLGATLALARLRAPVEIHGVVGLVENLVSGRAYKPGDVLRSRSGKTIEINNTDAEGRLVLADALDYVARSVRPEAIVDVATLTGACVVALGPNCSGVFSNNDGLAGDLVAAAARAGEKMWRLPLYPEYREQLKSDIADMRNAGGRWGGAITAGLFLENFVGDTPWAHLDIAGPAFLAQDDAFWGKGATGAAVPTLVEYALTAGAGQAPA